MVKGFVIDTKTMTAFTVGIPFLHSRKTIYLLDVKAVSIQDKLAPKPPRAEQLEEDHHYSLVFVFHERKEVLPFKFLKEPLAIKLQQEVAAALGVAAKTSKANR